MFVNVIYKYLNSAHCSMVYLTDSRFI